jgi:hypothetical protein
MSPPNVPAIHQRMKVWHQSIMREITEECNDRGRSRPRERGPDLSPSPNVPEIGANIPALNYDFHLARLWRSQMGAVLISVAVYLLQPF